ncbi:MAG: YbaK/EbsC family protein [Bryobacteraceae bacterium]|nr:YbaK/EbsC family protein [Bryobacteraceae bacterium]
MPANKLREFLDQKHVKYITIRHSVAYTAQEIASLTHIPGSELAKTVMVKMDGEMAMAVVPASQRVDLTLLKKVAGVDNVELATETEFKYRFPDCEAGAMPPFGNLYKMPVYSSEDLRLDEDIAFNAGTHSELVRLKYQDYERLVQPRVARISH